MLSIFIGVSIREVMGDGPPHIFGQEGMREGAVRGRAKDPKTPAPKHSMVDNGDIITFICIIHFQGRGAKLTRCTQSNRTGCGTCRIAARKRRGEIGKGQKGQERTLKDSREAEEGIKRRKEGNERGQ